MKFLILSLLLLSITGCTHINLKENTPAYDSRLSQFKYPFPVKNFKLSTQKQSLEMSYMDIGPKDSTKVVVLLHGKNFSGFYWKKIATDLKNKGYRVIVPDQIGFGKSSKPNSYQYSFPQLAINTQKLLRSLGINSYHLVGHSMGGMLAITMADMFNTEVTQLVLVNPIGLETYLDYSQFKDTNFFYNIELNKTAQKAINYQRKNYYDGKWSEQYEDLLKPTIGQINGSQWPLVAWNNALTYGPISSEDMNPKLKKLSVPTYLIIGTRDRTGPGRNWKKPGILYEFGRYDLFAKKVKKINSKVITIELKGLGHMPQFEDYKTFSKSFFTLFD